MSDARIPLYLITGFLDSGKTTLLTDTLNMDYFNDGQRTVLLMCEDGETEYDPQHLSHRNCRMIPVEDKEQLRQLAMEAGLSLHGKKDSQDICFVPDGDYMAYLTAHGLIPREGNFIRPDGTVLGPHKGMEAYTVGQRRGLGLAFGERAYVLGKRGPDVVLGAAEGLLQEEVAVGEVNYLPFDRLDEPLRVEAKLRYVNFTTGHEQEQVIAFDEDSLPTHLRGHKLHIFKMLSHKSRVKGDYQKALRGEFDAWMHLIDTAAVDAKPAEAEVTFDGVDQGIVEEGTFETDGWTYRAFVDKDGRKTANIVDSSIDADSDSMVIPSTLDGYWVTGIELESIPASVQTVFMQEDGSGTWIITNSKPSKRKLTVVYYADWEGAGRPAEMQKNDLMWFHVTTMDFADGIPRGGRVRKETLPQEINGRRVLFPKGSTEFLFTSGDWAYYLEDMGKVSQARLYEYLGDEQSEALFVPAAQRRNGHCASMTASDRRDHTGSAPRAEQTLR